MRWIRYGLRAVGVAIILYGLFLWSAFEGLCDSGDGCGSTRDVVLPVAAGVLLIVASLMPSRRSGSPRDL